MDPLLMLVAFVVGLVAGMVTGFTGGSGVVVVVPLLSLFCGLSVHSAIAASLFVDTLASLAVTYVYLRNGRVEVRDGLVIGLSSIAGAQAGALIASATSESRISRSFGIFTIVLGFMMMRRSRGRGCSPETSHGSRLIFQLSIDFSLQYPWDSVLG